MEECTNMAHKNGKKNGFRKVKRFATSAFGYTKQGLTLAGRGAKEGFRLIGKAGEAGGRALRSTGEALEQYQQSRIRSEELSLARDRAEIVRLRQRAELERAR